MSILAGDGNLIGNATLVRVEKGGYLAWTSTQHRFKGNVLFADGHVEQWSGGSSPSGCAAGEEKIVLPTIKPPPNSQDTAPVPANQSNPASLPTQSSNGSNNLTRESPAPRPASNNIPATDPAAKPLAENPNQKRLINSPQNPSAPNSKTVADLPVNSLKPKMELTPPTPMSTAVSPINSVTTTNPRTAIPVNPVGASNNTIEFTTTNSASISNAVADSSGINQSTHTGGWSWLWLLWLLLLISVWVWLSLRNAGRPPRK